jgi:hypothetical protein
MAHPYIEGVASLSRLVVYYYRRARSKGRSHRWILRQIWKALR